MKRTLLFSAFLFMVIDVLAQHPPKKNVQSCIMENNGTVSATYVVIALRTSLCASYVSIVLCGKKNHHIGTVENIDCT